MATKKCNQCNTVNPALNQFCAECGSSLEPKLQQDYGQASAYGQAPSRLNQRLPIPNTINQSNAYIQPRYGQLPQGYTHQPPNAYIQPRYGQPQQAFYAQPVVVGRKANPLLIVVVVAIAALVLLGGGFFLLGSGDNLPLPSNSTKVVLSSADQTELAKSLKDTTYSFYTSKDSISILKSFYTDKMKGKGYTLDNRSSSTNTTEQLVFIKGDKAALVLIIQLDSTTINQLETNATSFKGKLKDGEVLVGLVEGKASTITT